MFGFNGEQSLPGTVLRVPLRTGQQAKFSEIEPKSYATVAEFARMAGAVEKGARETSLLVFARHLCSVRFQVLEELPPVQKSPRYRSASQRPSTTMSTVEDDPDQSAAGQDVKGTVPAAVEAPAAEAEAVDDAEVVDEPAAESPGGKHFVDAEEEPSSFSTFWELSMTATKAVDRWSFINTDWKPSGFGGRFAKMFAVWKPPKTRDFLAFRFKDSREEHTDNWCICSTLGAGESRELAVDPKLRHFPGLVPVGSVAVHVARDGQPAPPVDGQEFCCFPVGRKTGLPVHIHGLFVLPQNEKAYHTMPTTDVTQHMQAEWNTSVFQSILESYNDVLVYLASAEAQSVCMTDNPGRLYKYWPAVDSTEPIENLLVRPLYRLLADMPMFLNKHGVYDVLESGFIATTQVKPAVQKFVSEQFAIFDIPAAVCTKLHSLHKAGEVGALSKVKSFGPRDLRDLLRRRGAKLKVDPQIRDMNLACSLLEYCVSDLLEVDNFSEVIGVRLMPLASEKLSVIGRQQMYTTADQAVMDLVPVPPDSFVHPHCLEFLPKLFCSPSFLTVAKASRFGNTELAKQLAGFLPRDWRGARVVTNGMEGKPVLTWQWTVGFWKFVNREHDAAHEGGEQSDWEATLSEFDDWPLIPICVDPAASAAAMVFGGTEQRGGRHASVSCRHNVLRMPPESQGFSESLRTALIGMGVLVLDPKFAGTGLFRDQPDEPKNVVEMVIDRLGAGVSRLNGSSDQQPTLDPEGGDTLLEFFNVALEDGSVALSDVRKDIMRRCPVFETTADSKMIAIDVLGGCFTFQVRDPTAWNITRRDGPNHLRLWLNEIPEHLMALITSVFAPCSRTYAEGCSSPMATTGSCGTRPNTSLYIRSVSAGVGLAILPHGRSSTMGEARAAVSSLSRAVRAAGLRGGGPVGVRSVCEVPAAWHGLSK